MLERNGYVPLTDPGRIMKLIPDTTVSFNPEPFLPPRTLRFRGIPDTLALHHLEASECCLIHYDNPISSDYGVFLNPQVRVGYRESAYSTAKSWPLARDIVFGWFTRMGILIGGFPWTDRKIDVALRNWEGREIGKDCLIDEMQILADNGWKHL